MTGMTGRREWTWSPSGSRGLHVHVPLDREADFDEVRSFAADLADILVARDPERLTRAHRKEKRGVRILLDVLRNAYAQTSVVPYGVRAREGAPVAVPLLWEELGHPGMHARRFTGSEPGNWDGPDGFWTG